MAARQAAAAADARKLESVVTREDSNGNRIGVTLTRNYQMPKYATDNNGNLKYAAIPQTTQEEVAPEEEAPTPTQTPATKPAPRLLSTPEAIPTTSMEDLPTLADYNKTVSGLASDFSAKLAAARKPFDEAVAKFDQEPSIESVPMSNKDQIRSIRKNARNDIRAIRRGK